MDEAEGISQEAQTETTTETTNATDDTRGLSYHDRMRADGEFAVEENRKKDSHIGQLNQRLARVKDLEPYLDALGGSNALIELANLGHQVRSNPQLQAALQGAISGNANTKPAEPEADLFDPEVKLVYDQFKIRFDKQEQIIADLQSRLNRTEVASVKGSLRENMEKALSVFSADPESLESAKGEILRAIENDERAAANGDRSAAARIEALAGPSGPKTLRMYTIDIYDQFVEKQLSKNTPAKPDGAALRSKATDERSATRSTPPSDAISVKSGVKPTSQLARQIMEEATSRHGKDPKSFWN